MHKRYTTCCLYIAFALASVLSLLAQSDFVDPLRDDLQQAVASSSQTLQAANPVEGLLMASVSNNSELPDAPSSARQDTSGGQPDTRPVLKQRSSRGARPAAVGGSFGVDRDVVDRKYVALIGAMFSTSIANTELTMHCLKYHTCAYVPGLLRSRPALYGFGISADVGISYLTYYLKNKHNSFWFVPAALVTAANVYVGVHAYRITLR